jgi:hypothetical protein
MKMKTRNMPYAVYLRRIGALERLEANKRSGYPIRRYAESPMGEHEAEVLDERINGYTESGKRPARMVIG